MGARNGNRQVRFPGRPVHICVSRDEKSLCNGRAERFNYGRVRLGSLQGIFVNVSRFHRAEHNQRD